MICTSGTTSAQRRNTWPSSRRWPSPTRLAYRELIKQTILEVVQHPHADMLAAIAQATAQVPQADRDEV